MNAHHQEWLKSMNLTDCHGITTLDFQTHQKPIGNCLDLLLIDVPGVVVDPPLGNSYHFSNSFSVKIGSKIPNITFSHKVYLKSHVDWLCVGEDLCNSN